jgi:hypothetical protein
MIQHQILYCRIFLSLQDSLKIVDVNELLRIHKGSYNKSNPISTYMFRKSSSSLNNNSSINRKNTQLNINSMIPLKLG